MTIQEVAAIVGSLGALLAICNIVWTWHTNAQLPSKNALKDMEGKVDEHDRRLTLVESELRHIPTKDDLSRVELSIERMLGELRGVQVELKGSSRTLQRLDDHLRGERA